MLAGEKWEAMGLPVWSQEGGSPHPWATLVAGAAPSLQRSARPDGTLSDHVLGTLAGNAMHLGAVGAALLCALGCTTAVAGGAELDTQPAD